MGMDCPSARDKTINSTFCATHLEFIILVRDDEDTIEVPDVDVELGWGIPDHTTFDNVVAKALFHFTPNDADRNHSLT